MSVTSFDRILVQSRLASPAMESGEQFLRLQSMRLLGADRDELRGRLGSGRSKTNATANNGANLSRLIDQRVPLRRKFGDGGQGEAGALPAHFDQRQRVIAKVHYFNHVNGGAAALKAHAKYVARDAAGREQNPKHATLDRETNAVPERSANTPGAQAGAHAKAHAAYLTRDGATPSVFYDARADGVDGAARAEAWAKADKRHFRVILSAEEGCRLGDLAGYTREVMARAEATLGVKLQWVAVDHHDTDNPHTHIIVRGRRENGKDLILPKDFVKHGFRNVARDVATEWLGTRTADDERLALQREIVRQAPTRLDRMISAQLPEGGALRIGGLEAPNGDPALTQALKARAHELKRMGLAHEAKRNTLAFVPDWRKRLQAMELHLNIRRRVVQERTLAKHAELGRVMRDLTRGRGR